MTTEVRRRARRSLSPSLTYVVAGVLFVCAALYLAHWGRSDGLDLRVYRAGIASWRGGHDPYSGTFTLHRLHFTYPPFALLALAPLDWAPFAATQIMLWTLSILALALAVYVICRRSGRAGGATLAAQSLGWASLTVILVEPVRSTLDYGQINTLLLALVVVDLLAVPRRHRGWLIGLAAAIKVTPLIFLALPLLARDTKTVARGLAALAGTSGLMWLLWPGAARTYWTSDLFAAKRVGTIAYAGNQSLYGLLHRWPFPSNGLEAVWLLLCAAAVVMGLSIAHRCLADDRRVAAMLSLALLGVLISPISWTHHWVWVALIPPLLVADRGRGMPGPARTALWALCGVSILAPYWWFSTGLAADVLADSLVLTGLGVLIVWSRSEYSGRARPALADRPNDTVNQAAHAARHDPVSSHGQPPPPRT
jgi:alpha-1,2-mannosyltransferase